MEELEWETLLKIYVTRVTVLGHPKYMKTHKLFWKTFFSSQMGLAWPLPNSTLCAHFSPRVVSKKKRKKKPNPKHLGHFAHQGPSPYVSPKQLFKKIVCHDSPLEKVMLTSFCHFDYLVSQFPKTCTAVLFRMEMFQVSGHVVPP